MERDEDTALQTVAQLQKYQIENIDDSLALQSAWRKTNWIKVLNIDKVAGIEKYILKNCRRLPVATHN